MKGRWVYVVGIVGVIAVLGITLAMATAAQADGSPVPVSAGLYVMSALVGA